MASIRKRGSSYFIDYRLNGKRIRKHIGADKKQAEQVLKEIESKVEQEKHGHIPSEYPYVKLFYKFDEYCTQHFSPNTQVRYKTTINKFQNFLSKQYSHIKDISDFNSDVFIAFRNYREAQGVAYETINKDLIILRLMFRLGKQWTKRSINPVEGVSALEAPLKERPRYLSHKECQKLLQACDEWFYPILYTFLNTGITKKELENLEWSHIDLDTRVLHIILQDDWDKDALAREIPINEGLYQVLLNHKTKNEDAKFVFTNEHGNKLTKNELRKQLMALTQACGCADVTQLYVLRHTFAVRLASNGVDPITVKELLGHADIKTTMIYFDLSKDQKRSAVEQLGFKEDKN